MTEFPLVGYALLFVVVGAGFVFINLLVGWLIRPSKPSGEKGTIYECGEPTIGSAWVQFDLRFYVVALLFVIFDVEVAFFFPWAVLFGQTNNLAQTARPETEEARLAYNRQIRELIPNYDENLVVKEDYDTHRTEALENKVYEENQAGASSLGWIAFWDILVFFGVLLVGFAYLWKRGDLQWVRSTAAERLAMRQTAATPGGAQTLAGVGSGS
jgi:NADH-quinone oxidoreductase subunit A